MIQTMFRNLEAQAYHAFKYVFSLSQDLALMVLYFNPFPWPSAFTSPSVIQLQLEPPSTRATYDVPFVLSLIQVSSLYLVAISFIRLSRRGVGNDYFFPINFLWVFLISLFL